MHLLLELTIYLIPLCFAVVYVLLLPVINSGIESLMMGVINGRNKIRHEMKLFVLNNKKMEVRVEKELEDIRAGLQDISRLNDQISELKNVNLKLVDENDVLNKSVKEGIDIIQKEKGENEALINRVNDGIKLINLLKEQNKSLIDQSNRGNNNTDLTSDEIEKLKEFSKKEIEKSDKKLSSLRKYIDDAQKNYIRSNEKDNKS